MWVEADDVIEDENGGGSMRQRIERCDTNPVWIGALHETILL